MINYHLISAAINYYSSIGYNYLEVPWAVSREVVESTKPESADSVQADFGYLVASGEQSFIQLMEEGKVLGKHCCATPCFRPKDRGTLHHPYFFKVELIDTNASLDSLLNTISAAMHFIGRYLPIRVIQTEEGKDIVSDSGLELGSYGIRTWKNYSWVYGTGVAEPRLSEVIGIEKNL